MPFTAVGDVVGALAKLGFPQILGSPVFLQVAFNLLLFFPVGFVLHRRFGWSAPAVVGGSLGVSL